MRVTLDKAGRVVIPKSVRDELHLEAGDTLEHLLQGESLTLRPLLATTRLRKKQGILVFGGTEPMTAEETDAVFRSVREQRDRNNRAFSC
jgi:AbrB family looped-hinge helix DNA binding protein